MAKPDLTTYGGDLLEVGYAGQVTHAVITSEIDSKTNEGATAIDFGIAVARGTTGDNTCKAVAADGDEIIGISVRLPNRPASSAGVVNYAQNDSVAFLHKGYIFAIPFENVARGTAVLSITAQGGKLGSTTGGAAGAGRVAVVGSVWETTTVAGAVGKLRVRI